MTSSPDAAAVLLRNVIVGATFFSAGLALYLALQINVRDAIRLRDPWPLAYAANRICVATAILLIAEVVFAAPEIPWTWRAVLYAVAILGFSVSAFFIVLDHRRRNRRAGDH